MTFFYHKQIKKPVQLLICTGFLLFIIFLSKMILFLLNINIRATVKKEAQMLVFTDERLQFIG